MNIILLSGGSGKRLWPLSNDIRSKQFIKIFKKPKDDWRRSPNEEYADASAAPDANTTAGQKAAVSAEDAYESMLQRVYRQIKAADPEATVTLATGKSQVSAIHNQLGEGVGISVEPCRRDTFPAIALATAYLHDVKGIPAEEAVVVCPVDPYVDEGYFAALHQLWELAQQGTANLVLMGIHPTYPSEKYGYIIPKTKDTVAKVSTFKEKPDAATAQQYIGQGGLWNGGVFAYKISYVLERARQLLGFTDYADLFSRYDTLTKISFDYAVVEHEPDIAVMRFTGEWKDLGTWNTLTEAMEENVLGDARLNETCRNVHVLNELGIPILAMGLQDVVIAASSEGILVADKEQSSYIKPFVDAIDQQVMFAEKSWGQYQVLDAEENSMTIKVTLNPGHRMNYHSHDKRDEVWTVVSGKGRTIVDGMEQPVQAGDVITMAAGCKHTVIADTKLQLIEVQLGNDISVNDKHKYELEI
ncbi:sugar phosphate nucleotidyltransferase [uncultured Succiniclasticum sp.]|uniref:sugar phosphate nucleotidyltransferase n=1 Tax=uncultured Succiniclasticum sp. TaxID=1500547 RepID=UPI0025D29948|nr:sugar phosphate nucleotidyltransferase [uncultured Succiniclasticum sp.]